MIRYDTIIFDNDTMNEQFKFRMSKEQVVGSYQKNVKLFPSITGIAHIIAMIIIMTVIRLFSFSIICYLLILGRPSVCYKPQDPQICHQEIILRRARYLQIGIPIGLESYGSGCSPLHSEFESYSYPTRHKQIS